MKIKLVNSDKHKEFLTDENHLTSLEEGISDFILENFSFGDKEFKEGTGMTYFISTWRHDYEDFESKPLDIVIFPNDKWIPWLEYRIIQEFCKIHVKPRTIKMGYVDASVSGNGENKYSIWIESYK